MPPEESAVVAPAAVAVAPAPAPDRGPDLIAKYVELDAKGKAAEAVAAPKADAKPEPKAQAKPAPEAKAKIDPKTIKLEADKPEPEPDPAAVRERARYHLQHGDVAKAIDAAFGDLEGIALPDAVREALGRKLGVKSEQWEKIRKHEQSVKRHYAAKEQELSGIVDGLKRTYGPLHEARASYQKGDYDAAFKQAFGEDAADFQRKLIGQRVAKNPEVEQLKVQLERERHERLADKQSLTDAQAKAEEQQAVNAYVANLQEQLTQSDDPRVAKYAQRPRFVNRVFEIQAAAYDRDTNTTMPLSKAAEQARDEVLGLISEWEPDTGASAGKADQASALPAIPERARARGRSLKHSQAAEATATPRKLSTQELIAKHSKLIELS